MRKTFFGFFILVFLLFPGTTLAQEGLEIAGQIPTVKETYSKATVTKVVAEGTKKIGDANNFSQDLIITLENGKTIAISYGGMIKTDPNQKLHVGDELVVLASSLPNKTTDYHIIDRYRLTPLPFLLVGFFLLVIAFAGKKGLGAIIGMIISLAVIMLFIVPQILSGNNPLFISILGALFILIVTIYLSHGFSRQTTVAVLATFIALIITGVLAISFVELLSLQGLGNEENAALQIGAGFINLKGLLLGGIIIGALGVLDDTTTTQAAAIFELAKTDHKLTMQQLIEKGLSIGKEHIAALVNTLVLAYAGVSLSIFILFSLNPAQQPYWVIFNSEHIVEEVVRTVSGSVGLVLAVPITTLLAAWIAKSSVKKP